jgi:hypothetical protein
MENAATREHLVAEVDGILLHVNHEQQTIPHALCNGDPAALSESMARQQGYGAD